MLLCSCVQVHSTITPTAAYRYVGCEIIVKGKMIAGGNSSYAQYSWFYLGPDSAHKQLEVRIQGKLYTDYPGRNSFASYLGKVIVIKGKVTGESKNVYLVASDILKLAKR